MGKYIVLIGDTYASCFGWEKRHRTGTHQHFKHFVKNMNKYKLVTNFIINIYREINMIYLYRDRKKIATQFLKN